MSKNTKMLGTSIKPGLLQEVDSIRGQIPRSRIVERALRRFLLDVQIGKVAVLDLKQGEKEEGQGAPVTNHKRQANTHDVLLCTATNTTSGERLHSREVSASNGALTS